VKGQGCPVVEIEAQQTDSYRGIAEHAANILKIHPLPGKSFMLYKYSGVAISDNDVTVKGEKKWTLGTYLLACKKSPSQIKLGIGYLSDDDYSSLENDEVCSISCNETLVKVAMHVYIHCVFTKVLESHLGFSTSYQKGKEIV